MSSITALSAKWPIKSEIAREPVEKWKSRRWKAEIAAFNFLLSAFQLPPLTCYGHWDTNICKAFGKIGNALYAGTCDSHGVLESAAVARIVPLCGTDGKNKLKSI